MRQEKCVTQYEPLAARDDNGNWYKIKDHEVREVEIRDSEQGSEKSTNLSQPRNEDARRGTLTIHGASCASDATKAKRHRSALSTSKAQLQHSALDRQHDLEHAEPQDSVFRGSSINDPAEMEISSEINRRTNSPAHMEEDDETWCFCQDAAYGDMVA
jgi:hypothetical protein